MPKIFITMTLGENLREKLFAQRTELDGKEVKFLTCDKKKRFSEMSLDGKFNIYHRGLIYVQVYIIILVCKSNNGIDKSWKLYFSVDSFLDIFIQFVIILEWINLGYYWPYHNLASQISSILLKIWRHSISFFLN